MSWDATDFYSKAKSYIAQAERLQPEDRFYVFWYFTAFEHLLRACFAQSAKALLADARNAKNVLYAYGVEIDVAPTQRNMNELVELSGFIVSGLNAEIRKKLGHWLFLRNEELHTGADKLREIAQSSWQGDYYEATSLMLNHLGKQMSDFFGTERVKTIEKVLVSKKETTAKETKNEIGKSRSYFERLKQVEVEAFLKDFKRPAKTKVAKCPACGQNTAAITGEVINAEEAQYEDGDLFQIVKMLPKELKCDLCRLDLKGYSAIDSAGLGAQFSIREHLDPVEQFNIDIEEEFRSKYPSRYASSYEDEYQDE